MARARAPAAGRAAARRAPRRRAAPGGVRGLRGLPGRDRSPAGAAGAARDDRRARHSGRVCARAWNAPGARASGRRPASRCCCRCSCSRGRDRRSKTRWPTARSPASKAAVSRCRWCASATARSTTAPRRSPAAIAGRRWSPAPSARVVFWDVAVFDGATATFPLAPAAPITCGNRVPLPGAFRLDGERPLRSVCCCRRPGRSRAGDRARRSGRRLCGLATRAVNSGGARAGSAGSSSSCLVAAGAGRPLAAEQEPYVPALRRPGGVGALRPEAGGADARRRADGGGHPAAAGSARASRHPRDLLSRGTRHAPASGARAADGRGGPRARQPFVHAPAHAAALARLLPPRARRDRRRYPRRWLFGPDLLSPALRQEAGRPALAVAADSPHQRHMEPRARVDAGRGRHARGHPHRHASRCPRPLRGPRRRPRSRRKRRAPAAIRFRDRSGGPPLN